MAEDVVKIDEEIEIDKIEFVDKKRKKKVIKKKKITKKATKKKEIATKKKKVKTIEPVGEVKPIKTVADAAIELDSRGNPTGEKVSDTLQHLIDSLNAPKDIGFADTEQAQERLDKRNNIERS